MRSMLKSVARYGLGRLFLLVATDLPGLLPQPNCIRRIAHDTIGRRPRIDEQCAFQDELWASERNWEAFQTQCKRKRFPPLAFESTVNHEKPALPHSPFQTENSFDLQLGRSPWDCCEIDRDSKRKRTMNRAMGPVHDMTESLRKPAFQRPIDREDEVHFPRPLVFIDMRPSLSGGPARDSNLLSGKQDELVELDLLSGLRGVRTSGPTSDESDLSGKIPQEIPCRRQRLTDDLLHFVPALCEEGSLPYSKSAFELGESGNNSLLRRSSLQHGLRKYRPEDSHHQKDETTIKTILEVETEMPLATNYKNCRNLMAESDEHNEINQTHSVIFNHSRVASSDDLHHLESNKQASSSAAVETDMAFMILNSIQKGFQSSLSETMNSGRKVYDPEEKYISPVNLSQTCHENGRTKQNLLTVTHVQQKAPKSNRGKEKNCGIENQGDLFQNIATKSIQSSTVAVDMEVVKKELFEKTATQNKKTKSNLSLSPPDLTGRENVVAPEVENNLAFIENSQTGTKLTQFFESLKRISQVEFFKDQPVGQIWTDPEHAHTLLDSYQYYKSQIGTKGMKDAAEDFDVLKYFFHLAEEEAHQLSLNEKIENSIGVWTISLAEAMKSNQIYYPKNPTMHYKYFFVTKVLSQVRSSCKGVLLLVRIFYTIFRDPIDNRISLREQQYQSWEFLKQFWNEFIMFQTTPTQSYSWAESSTQAHSNITKVVYQICKNLAAIKRNLRIDKSLTFKIFTLWLEINRRKIFRKIGNKLYYARQGWISFVFHLLHLSCPYKRLDSNVAKTYH